MIFPLSFRYSSELTDDRLWVNICRRNLKRMSYERSLLHRRKQTLSRFSVTVISLVLKLQILVHIRNIGPVHIKMTHNNHAASSAGFSSPSQNTVNP